MVARGTPNAEAPGSSPGCRYLTFASFDGHGIALYPFFSTQISSLVSYLTTELEFKFQSTCWQFSCLRIWPSMWMWWHSELCWRCTLYTCSWIVQIIRMGACNNTRVKDIGITHQKHPIWRHMWLGWGRDPQFPGCINVNVVTQRGVLEVYTCSWMVQIIRMGA